MKPPVPVLFEDNHLLCVIKPADIPVQEDASGNPDLLNILKAYLKEKYNKPGNVFLGLVHRLDRPVYGAMVFARTSKAASRLSDQIRRRVVKKVYRAVVEGNPPDNGTLTDFLLKDRKSNVVSVVPPSEKGAQKAVLHFKKLKSASGLHLLEIELETGRPHQIRVQCSQAGFPVWGDYKYGLKQAEQNRTIALQSAAMEFEHPVQKDIHRIEAPLPDFEPWNRFRD